MATEMTVNPFGASQLQPRENAAMVQQESDRAVAEVRSAMQIAKMFPRDQVQAMDRILNACARSGLASAALYSYARGGTEITGPSIRLAEALAQNWGNLQFGVRELEQRGAESTVEAFAWDMETNTRQTKVFQVKHERHTRNGATRLTDPRDVYELVANQGSRRLRACILSIIPGDVIEAAVDQCEKTLNATEQPTPEKIKAMIDAFGKFGVTTAHLEKRIQRRMDAITAPQMVQLRKIYTSLKDGMSSAAEWFDVQAAANGEPAQSKIAEALSKRTQKPSEPAQVRDAEIDGDAVENAPQGKDDAPADNLDHSRHNDKGKRECIGSGIHGKHRTDDDVDGNTKQCFGCYRDDQ